MFINTIYVHTDGSNRQNNAGWISAPASNILHQIEREIREREGDKICDYIILVFVMVFIAGVCHPHCIVRLFIISSRGAYPAPGLVSIIIVHVIYSAAVLHIKVYG